MHIQSAKDRKRQLKWIEKLSQEMARERQRSLEAGLPEEYLPMALAGYQQMLDDLWLQVEEYDRLARGEVAPSGLAEVGRQIPRLRVALGLSQRELAVKLGVSEAQVSRDERHEYEGVSLRRAQAILERLGVQAQVHYHLPATSSVVQAHEGPVRYEGGAAGSPQSHAWEGHYRAA